MRAHKMIDNAIVYQLVGERICELRKLNNDNQGDLSKKIGISRSSISNIELGRQPASLGLLYQIAQVYNTEISSLLPTLVQIMTIFKTDDKRFNELLQKTNVGNNTRQQILDLIK
jgi:transcriptional regulator with XRE-family HTH domain